MQPQSRIVAFATIAVALLVALGSDDGGVATARETLNGCSSHCKLSKGGSVECWHRTREFFERSLASSLRNYVLSSASVASAQKERGESLDWREMAARILRRLFAHQPPLIGGDKNAAADNATYTQLVDSILANAHVSGKSF